MSILPVESRAYLSSRHSSFNRKTRFRPRLSLGTSASSASVRSTGSIAKPLLDDLGIDSNTRKREATRNSC